jgi:hypothetical protein
MVWPLVLVITLPKQLRQPRNVDGNPARPVLRQHLRLQRFGRVVAGVQVGERLAVGITDDITAGILSTGHGGGNRRGDSANRGTIR